MSAVKISVSLDDSDLRWLRIAARRRKKTVSGLLSLAVERMRREEALDQVIAYLGEAAQLSEADIREIETEWKG
jgi:hypothetical protein